jgi:hypothetical protein
LNILLLLAVAVAGQQVHNIMIRMAAVAQGVCLRETLLYHIVKL